MCRRLKKDPEAVQLKERMAYAESEIERLDYHLENDPDIARNVHHSMSLHMADQRRNFRVAQHEYDAIENSFRELRAYTSKMEAEKYSRRHGGPIVILDT